MPAEVSIIFLAMMEVFVMDFLFLEKNIAKKPTKIQKQRLPLKKQKTLTSWNVCLSHGYYDDAYYNKAIKLHVQKLPKKLKY